MGEEVQVFVMVTVAVAVEEAVGVGVGVNWVKVISYKVAERKGSVSWKVLAVKVGAAPGV